MKLRQALQDFVRWTWIIHILIFFFMFMTWRVMEWFMMLKEPSAVQAGVVGGIFGILPALGTLYTVAIAKIPSPTEASQ